MKFTLIITLFLAVFNYSFSQQSDSNVEKIALEYMEAYGNWDFDKMKTFYADNVIFEDPTGTEAFGQSFMYEGKEKVHSFFQGIFKDKFENDKPPYVDFIIEKTFFSGSFAIINSTFECVIPTSWYKEGSDETVLVAVPFVTVLKIKNGLIESHTDYGDYKKYNTQIQSQLKN